MFELLQSTNVYGLAVGVVCGMIVGGLVVQGLRQRWKIWPQAAAWQLAAYGGGIFLGGSLLGGCILFLGGGGLGTPTPTATPARPTATPTPVKSRATSTPTPTPAPVLPATFDITLNFTNNSCGYADAQFPFTFTIAGGALTLLQVDADITTTGSYDAATGAFMASGPVGPGTETYEGVIAFDGTTISVTGTGGYAQAGQCTSVNDIAGETTVP